MQGVDRILPNESFPVDDKVAAAVLPYGTKPGPGLARLPLGTLRWPLGTPLSIEGTISDLGPDDHLLVYPSSRLYYMPRPGVRCKVSVMIVEPAAVHKRHMRLMRLFHRRFHKVLTCNPDLEAAIPNALHFVFGSSWVSKEGEINRSKTRSLSLIASSKTSLEGHRLRHAVADWLIASSADAEVMGRAYRPFEKKSEGLAPFRYSVVIENVREAGYFTEKLVDCLLCDTVPIYWGAPDIGKYFDKEGMLICDSLDDIKAAIGNLSEADYRRRRASILINRQRAMLYADHEQNAARLVTTGRMLAEDPV